MNNAVQSLTVYNNVELIAGGSFTTAGGVNANYIARWNGIEWLPLGSGMGAGGFGMTSVVGLAVYDYKITACGNFTTAGGVSVNRIAKCDYNTICGDNYDKVLVCHKGNTICISPNAVPAHLMHGDYLGECTEGMDNITSIPGKFVLYDNYPNPFNPVTRIKFDLPENANTKLVIYDVLGRAVSVIADGYLTAGTHIIDWNGSDCSSGVYFYRITADNFTDTKKMFLMK